VVSANIAMLIFGTIGVFGGLAIFIWTGPILRFFKLLSDTMTIYPQKLRSAVFTAGNLRWGGAGYLAFGTLCFAILIWRVNNGYDWAA
jgi:hypothetical protein